MKNFVKEKTVAFVMNLISKSNGKNTNSFNENEIDRPVKGTIRKSA